MFPEFAAPLTPCNLPLQRQAASAQQHPRRILVARTIANGDILMSTPLLTGLRAAWPDAHITYLVEQREREAINAHPCVDRILLWDTPYWKQPTRRGLYPLLWLRAARLRRLLCSPENGGPFDVLISLMPEDFPFLVRASGAPISIGVFDTFREYQRRKKTSRRARLYSHAFTHVDLPVHRTDQYLLPLRALGLPEPADKRMTLGYTPEDVAQAAECIPAGSNGKFAVIAPVTGWPSRNWPAERYAALADRLIEEGCGIVLVGSGKDRPAVEGVTARMRHAERAVIAAGRFGFRALGALMAKAALVISGDTGPMHAAAAVGTPYLALFGPTPTEGRAPLAGAGHVLAHPVPCGPCDQKRCRFPEGSAEHLRCLHLISVEEAYAAARRLLLLSSGSTLPVVPTPAGLSS